MDKIITFLCLLGVICAILTFLLNANLVFRIVLIKAKRMEEMTLFYYRFVIDILFSFSLLIYIIFIELLINYPEFMSNYESLNLFLAMPWSNLGACRSLIALAIAIDRVLATIFPIKYRLKRGYFPNWVVLTTCVLFGGSEWLVLFVLCGPQPESPPSCRVLGCAVNQCFYNFWTGHKSIIFALIIILSLLLSIKLFIWNYLKNKKKSQMLSRANKFALLDTATVLLFDFLPSFGGTIWPTFPLFDFDVVGPYTAVGKVIGCAIEAVVVSTVLLSKTTVAVENTSSQQHRANRKSTIVVPKIVTN